MRTPNTACALCAKPLYRRPSDMQRSRYAACMGCRGRAQSVAGVTDAQRKGLAQGSRKGTNHRAGYKHREESKRKTAEANARFWAANPDAALARAKRGGDAYNWKGGISRLNTSIRQMTENRKWMDAIKARDGCCLRCDSTTDLEAHHKIELAVLVDRLGIKSRDDARRHGTQLWDLTNGETLCRRCHYGLHGRVFREAA